MSIKEKTALRRRMTINDVRDTEDLSLFVYNRSTRLLKRPTQILLPHAPARGRSIEINIPMTFIPIDLSRYAPKEELVNNSELMRMLNMGVLELVEGDEARTVLARPESIEEEARLMASVQMALANSADGMEQDENFRTVLPPQALQAGAVGDIDSTTNGITPSVVDAMTSPDDSHRASLLRNLSEIMTPKDRQYVRGQTSDSTIRQIVGEA